jgi:hypothetical protein
MYLNRRIANLVFAQFLHARSQCEAQRPRGIPQAPFLVGRIAAVASSRFSIQAHSRAENERIRCSTLHALENCWTNVLSRPCLMHSAQVVATA